MLIFVFSGIFASIAPVSGTPKLGFGTLPSIPVSLIDFHGIDDFTQPYDLEHSQGMPHFILYFLFIWEVFFTSELVFCLKGPNLMIFVSRIFTQIRAVWVGDLEQG